MRWICFSKKKPIEFKILSNPSLFVLFIYVYKEKVSRYDNWTTWKDRWEIRAGFSSNCVHFSLSSVHHWDDLLARIFTRERAEESWRKIGNVCRSTASPLPVIKRSYLSFVRAWKEFQTWTGDIRLLYIYRYIYIFTIQLLHVLNFNVLEKKFSRFRE